jgi:hypothetical protein
MEERSEDEEAEENSAELHQAEEEGEERAPGRAPVCTQTFIHFVA